MSDQSCDLSMCLMFLVFRLLSLIQFGVYAIGSYTLFLFPTYRVFTDCVYVLMFVYIYIYICIRIYIYIYIMLFAFSGLGHLD